MSKIHWKYKGLTLIESMVVLSIMSMLALLLFINYRGYNKRNQLREAAQQVRSALVEAQNMALAPKATDIGQGWYYGIAFDTSSTSYQFYSYDSSSQAKTLLRTYSLPNSIRLISIQISGGNTTPTLNLFFKPSNASAYYLTPSPSPPPPYSTITPETKTYILTLALPGNTYTTNITINCATGQTNVNNP